MSAERTKHNRSISDEELEICLRVLQAAADRPSAAPQSDRFWGLVSKVYRASKRNDERDEKWRKAQADRATMAATGMVRIQRDAMAAAALPPGNPHNHSTLNTPERCYICKASYTRVHFFYHLLCPECAEINYRMRALSCDLAGRTALVTGGRVKIGFQTVLRLLNDGARVILTTRFPRAAAIRFAAEPNSAHWLNRLDIYGMDLRNVPALEAFSRHLLDTEESIDILIHNAAQTVRRPPGFYDDLVQQESQQGAIEALPVVKQCAPPTVGIRDCAELVSAALPAARSVLPASRWEDNEELADNRDTNSWLLRLDEVTPEEMLEVQLVNSVAPFLLNSRLKPLLLRSAHARRFIVNVSAMEGQFRRHKTVFHPHTNMAKAALNMMTRTSADDYARDGIYMNSVDTGWVTDENPGPKRARIQEERGFYPPLDIIDGMARIYHPIVAGLTDAATPLYGKFLKDYSECAW